MLFKRHSVLYWIQMGFACLILVQLISFGIVFFLGFSADAVTNVKINYWKLKNSNGSININAQVPGGVYTDLYNAGVIGDILYRFNDVFTRWVGYETWTYEGQFNVTQEQHKHEVAKLVLYGVDTVAYIEINDSPVGQTNNMFVRYAFNVKQQLQVGHNTIKVVFVSPVEAAYKRSLKYFTPPQCVPDVYNGECHVNQLRKMQASFSWDWGPAFPSVGLWKPVVIEYYNAAIIRSVTTHITKPDAHWLLTVKAELEVKPSMPQWNGRFGVELTVESGQKITLARAMQVPVTEKGTADVELNLTISENVVRTWWPNGYGDQPLYRLEVSIDSTGIEQHYKTLEIGFRTIELIQEDASNRITNKTSEAAYGLTFYFKVNGYAMFMKGSNWIPAHVLPEQSADLNIVEGLLISAKDAHMNMLRVWGGGLYEWEYFYKLCDRLGILIWQDFLFACSMYPTDTEFIDTVKVEIEQNVKRLQYHPSIAIWAGNNENEAALRGNWYNTDANFNRYKADYVKLYVDTIKPIVELIDPGRPFIVSSPTNGLQSEKEGYIAANPYEANYGDTHYYNYMGDNWDYNIYPRTRFASEYGFQSMPSMKTIKTATSEKDDFNINSNFSRHRQHSPFGYETILSQIKMHLNLDKESSKNEVDKQENDLNYYKRIIYYSQITQAMAMKVETENYRQMQADWYTMGALYWQLNDVWQAPSWSGIEFGNNWKMLHYFAMKFFHPVLVSARLEVSGDVVIYLSNDRFVPINNGHIRVDVFNWDNFTPVMTMTYPAMAPALSTTRQDIQLPFWNMKEKDEVFLMFTLIAEGVENPPSNYLFPVPLKDATGINDPRVQLSITKLSHDIKKGLYKYTINIKVNTIVAFFWMETPIEHGYFEDNGVLLTKPLTKINYFNKKSIDIDILKNSIVYQYYTN